MSRFVRQETPPPFDNCKSYLPFLRRDFRYRCAYCERPEVVLGGGECFEIDHFRPVWRFRELEKHYPNLYYACGKCNRHKGRTWPSDASLSLGLRFADPCQEDMYAEHFEEMPDGTLLALTNCGRYTGAHIRLNRPGPRNWRRQRRRMAGELQIITHAVSRLEALIAVEGGLLKQQQLRQLRIEIETLKDRVARDRERFAL